MCVIAYYGVQNKQNILKGNSSHVTYDIKSGEISYTFS